MAPCLVQFGEDLKGATGEGLSGARFPTTGDERPAGTASASAADTVTLAVSFVFLSPFLDFRD